jgi:tungstate transport system substrate-binding protein
MSRIVKWLITLGVILSVGLTACGPAAEVPVATEAPVVTQAPAAPILAVTGLVKQELQLTEADLQGMGPVTLTLEHPKNGPTEYTGVRLSDLLEKAGLAEGAGALLITASDGYSYEAPLADLQACTDCLVAFADGKLNMAMPGMSGKAWVKDVVTLDLVAGQAAIPAPENPNLILATTTSTQDSGLLDVLLPAFQTATLYNVQTVAVGTGQALKMGEEGNADVLLVHAPSSEKTFMDNGFGSDRRLVMHNDFIVVGPAADPAAVKGLAAVEAFKAIYAAGATFVTRGDDSGTHKKELDLWKKAELDPAGQAWYLETGQGMGASLIVASEKGAYILTDRATFLANQDKLQLVILSEGDPKLLNVYHVIVVNPEKWPKVNLAGATAFADFLVSADGQALIGAFGVEKFGQPLFTPDAGKDEAELGL